MLCVNVSLRWRIPTPSDENVTLIPKMVAFIQPLQDANAVLANTGEIVAEDPVFLPVRVMGSHWTALDGDYIILSRWLEVPIHSLLDLSWRLDSPLMMHETEEAA